MKDLCRFLGAILLTVCWVLPAPAFQSGGDQFNPFSLWYDEGPHQVQPGQTYEVKILLQIPDQYYLYEEKLAVELNSAGLLKPGELMKPEAKLKDDPFMGKIVPVYYHEIEASLPIQIPATGFKGKQSVVGEIQFQGCSDKLCYRLMRQPLQVDFILQDSAVVATPVDSSANPQKELGFLDKIQNLLKAKDFRELIQQGFWWALLISFIGGVLTDFTPCVLPLIPITLGVIGVRKEQTMARNFITSLVLVSGMSVMYTVLGLGAASLGKSLGFLFQNQWFLILINVPLLLFALSLLGVFEIQLPAKLQTKLAQISGAGLRGVFLTGLTMGLIAAPCVGPIVGILLVFVAQSGELAHGFVFLLSYALGMGSLFIISGSLYGIVQLKLKSGPWSEWLKKILGVLTLLVMAFFLFSLTGAPKSELWYSSLDEGLSAAETQSRPTVIDFYAKWCAPCIELDKKVWETSPVITEIKNHWVAIKIDCTTETPACKQAIDEFQVIGWPTVVFLNRDQSEIKSERLVGIVVEADEMLTTMKKLR